MVNSRERLVRHVQELERLVDAKTAAGAELAEAFAKGAADGFDPTTLKVVLKLRKMTPDQRRERRALEAIYMAALGMLDGDALPESARRRFDRPPPPGPDSSSGSEPEPERAAATAPKPPEQPAFELKNPEDARREGGEAAAAGRRIYDNPFSAGDPCRAAWDEGWCAQRESHGMETPAAYQRRTQKPPSPDGDQERKGGQDDSKGAAA